MPPNPSLSSPDGKVEPVPVARLQEEPALVDDEDGGGWEEDDWGDMDVSGRSSSQLTALYLLPCCLQT